MLETDLAGAAPGAALDRAPSGFCDGFGGDRPVVFCTDEIIGERSSADVLIF